MLFVSCAGISIFMVMSCTKDTEPGIILDCQSPVCFEASLADDFTKGREVDVDNIMGTAASSGVGMFAYHQAAVNGHAVNFSRYTCMESDPDFMYNQKIGIYSGSQWSWSYDPVKYWPDSENDRVSFFAYAPYSEQMTWDRMNVTSDENGDAVRFSFIIDDDPSLQNDWIWAAPQLNLCKSQSVHFSFRHALARIGVYVGVEVDTDTGSPSLWTLENAEIKVNSVIFTNICEKAVIIYDTSDGSVSYEGSGSQRILMKRLDHFDESASIINTTNYGTVDISSEGGFKRLNREDCYLFLSPQDLAQRDVEVIIGYTVTVVDPVNPAITSSVSRNISRKLHADAHISKFAAGKAYKLKFLIGVSSSEFTLK